MGARLSWIVGLALVLGFSVAGSAAASTDPGDPAAFLSEASDFSHVSDFNGSDDVALSYPVDVAVSKRGLVFVLDKGLARIVVFNSAGNVVRVIGSKACGPWKKRIRNGKKVGLKPPPMRKFCGPTGIDLDADGDILVGDTGNRRVVRLSAAGNPVAQRYFPNRACGIPEIPARIERLYPCMPEGIAAEGGDIYVADVNGEATGRVKVFDAKLGQKKSSFVGQWGGGPKCTMAQPSGLCSPTDLDIAPNGAIFVTDNQVVKVEQFSRVGKLLGSFGQFGSGPGEFGGGSEGEGNISPYGIDVDSTGQNVIVTDPANSRIEVMTPNGAFKYQLGTKGSGPGQFELPLGVDFDYRGNFYVADAVNKRVSVFSHKTVP